MRVSHAKVSAASDTDDASLIQPSDWNADHEIAGFVADDAAHTSPLNHTRRPTR